MLPTLRIMVIFSRLGHAVVLCASLACFAAGCGGDESASVSVEAEATKAAISSVEPPLKTAVVGVRIGRNREMAIAFASRKDTPFDGEHEEGDLRVEARDKRTAALLGVGSARIPELCTCPANETHYEGDVKRAHEATVLVKVPYATGSETLTLVAQDRETGTPVTLRADLAEVAQ